MVYPTLPSAVVYPGTRQENLSWRTRNKRCADFYSEQVGSGPRIFWCILFASLPLSGEAAGEAEVTN